MVTAVVKVGWLYLLTNAEPLQVAVVTALHIALSFPTFAEGKSAAPVATRHTL